MKLLLDENLPHRLRKLLAGHEVFTVAYMGWSGVENGELLTLAGQSGFGALVTKDLGVPYQQNVGKLPCAVVVLQARTNSMEDVQPLVPALLLALDKLEPKAITVVK
jgi:predicted nuclease of predicted toxin-antitoxin system